MNFGEIIGGWYKKNGRDLPIRMTRDPYCTWLAEIILQQTRMEQGLPYLERFLEKFPELSDLAKASEEEVLKLWQGLGYYSRARNLHAAANYIYKELDGKFPETYAEILKLKGVGPYSAAAIASWCFKEAVPAVDGNVARVLARLYGVEEAVNSTKGQKIIYAFAEEVLHGAMISHKDAGLHNQAMIDFGATHCTPTSPSCNNCPLATACEAQMEGKTAIIPHKLKGRKPRKRWFYFYLIRTHEEVIIEKRGEGDIWQSLYQFPLVETGKAKDNEDILGKMLKAILYGAEENENNESGVKEKPIHNYGKHDMITSTPVYLDHLLSHQVIHACFIDVRVHSLPRRMQEKWRKIPLTELQNYPVPQLIHSYLESLKF